MKKTIWILLLISIFLTACGAGNQQGNPTNLPDEVDWTTAVQILNTGDVEQVFQLHNLTVTLIMKDGQEVKTVEPVIDAIFDEVQNCGAPCSDIILATE
jgi:hypothetical protein